MNSHNLIMLDFLSGNELSGIGIKARVEPYQYGKDMILLKQLLKELYKNTSMQAKLLGPGGFFNQTWYTKFLQSSGENVVDAITHHIYNLGPGQLNASVFHCFVSFICIRTCRLIQLVELFTLNQKIYMYLSCFLHGYTHLI